VKKRLVCTRTLIPDGVSTKIARKTTIGNTIDDDTIYFYIFSIILFGFKLYITTISFIQTSLHTMLYYYNNSIIL